MTYNIIISKDAEDDLKGYIKYLYVEKKNEQAAKSVLDDFEETIQSLRRVAPSLKLCENPRLKIQEYRRINFIKHRYFMLYRIQRENVYVDAIFHELQDYENKMN